MKDIEQELNRHVINLFHRMFNISEGVAEEYQRRTGVDIEKLTLRDSVDDNFLKKLKDFEKRLKLEKIINKSRK